MNHPRRSFDADIAIQIVSLHIARVDVKDDPRKMPRHVHLEFRDHILVRQHRGGPSGDAIGVLGTRNTVAKQTMRLFGRPGLHAFHQLVKRLLALAPAHDHVPSRGHLQYPHWRHAYGTAFGPHPVSSVADHLHVLGEQSRLEQQRNQTANHHQYVSAEAFMAWSTRRQRSRT